MTREWDSRGRLLCLQQPVAAKKFATHQYLGFLKTCLRSALCGSASPTMKTLGGRVTDFWRVSTS